MKKIIQAIAAFLPLLGYAQSPLTIEEIMQDPLWIGTSPSAPFWNQTGDTVFFKWNPEKSLSDSLYFFTLKNTTPQKALPSLKASVIDGANMRYNNERSAFVYAHDGDIFYKTIKPSKLIRITQTEDNESNPQFTMNGKAVVYQAGRNLFVWDIATGQTSQVTNFSNSRGGESKKKGLEPEQYLADEQTGYIKVLAERAGKRDSAKAYRELHKKAELRKLYTGNRQVSGLSMSPDGNQITYRLYAPPAVQGTGTIVPDYVTESGYTTDIPGRPKVGAPQGTTSLYVYDRAIDSLFEIKTDSLEGVRNIPDFYKDYPDVYSALEKKNQARPVNFGYLTQWSDDGRYLLFDARSQDNKDRWILVWDAVNHELIQCDHQHDEAWIGRIVMGTYGWINNKLLFFMSEKTGYSHLYFFNTDTRETTPLTAGDYEVQNVELSHDKKYFYLTTNETDPGQKQFYKYEISLGKKQQITTMTGANEVTVSPDGKNIAFLYSYSNKPWELFLQQNKQGSAPLQITDKAASDEWKAYPWRDPEVVTFKARDGAHVYARVFKPDNPRPGMPAVVFVHGAGYLQNAHKWWSSYFRENMFHNFLADNGYYVIDADYRGSAGYGRDWRTGIYRHMGGLDLTDNVDAANYLVETYEVDPQRIGIYGGSYGGFITLMAMFTTPDAFAAGAGLRSVTEWANYNHGYTSNILNEPHTDSIAYRKSSPIYFAEGLKGHLLMCHGLVDVNVHAQDIIKLTQRLIELKKENWELAIYPIEDHGFTEPTSWMDEYKRIFKLFETVLKK